MSDPTERSARGVLIGEDVHRIVRRLRAVGGIIALGLVLVVLVAAAGLVLRLFRPVAGDMSAVLGPAAAAILALAVGAGMLEAFSRKAMHARSLEAAVAAYKLGCASAGVLNFLAGCLTAVVFFTNGVANGLWVPQVLILALNVVGLALALPKMKHLRKLHYRPTLPVTRI